MEAPVKSVAITQNHKTGFSWIPFLLRAVVFAVAGAAIFLLCVLLVDTIHLRLNSAFGISGLRAILFPVATVAGISGAVLATNFVEGKPGFRRIRSDLGALASSHKVLMGCVAVPLLAAMVSPVLYSFAAPIPGFGACLVTAALGYSTRRQIMWVALVTLPFASFAISLGIGNAESNAAHIVRGAIGIGCLLTALVSQLLLVRRASKRLSSAGLVVKFFGVPFRDIPALSRNELVESTAAPLTPAISTSEDPLFYYVGPDNEPIGPISQQVLLQLRGSGVVSDDSMVAPEGESNWRPLREFIEVVSDEETESAI